MHNYYHDGTNDMKASWNERKQHSFIPIMFVLVWALTRFMMKGEN